jgi:hypothetical protein
LKPCVANHAYHQGVKSETASFGKILLGVVPLVGETILRG